jgi:branched-chain amino acid aminotransferase
VSRSIHYGLCLTFEGIRYYITEDNGKLSVVFLNIDKNIARFIRGISFNLSAEQQVMMPTTEELYGLILEYLRHPKLRRFLTQMAKKHSQGYLRPFTVDDDQSIGVTFPSNPTIFVACASYKNYLGEPFDGVVVPHLVRAIGPNGTGCLKLGVNYLLSVKAVAEAKKIWPSASSALFLDDRPYQELMSRKITEWDSSCCLIALKNGAVIKIPESNLILPSVTINGITKILIKWKVAVIERDLTYGEFLDLVNREEVVTVCSIGTAGILNRCGRLLLIDGSRKKIAMMTSDTTHSLYDILKRSKDHYWEIFTSDVDLPEGMNKEVFEIGRVA